MNVSHIGRALRAPGAFDDLATSRGVRSAAVADIEEIPSKGERWLRVALGGYALAAGLITLTGWMAGIDRLTDWTNSRFAMKAAAAIAAACAGAALLIA